MFHEKHQKSDNIARIAVVLIFAVILILQIKSIYTNASGGANRAGMDALREQLQAEIVEYARRNQWKQEQEQNLRELTEQPGDTDVLMKQLNESLTIARFLSGQSDVKGPGVIITIDTNERSVGMIRDTDLTQVINELWLSGAQAVSINGHRIVMQSSIRDTGEMIVNKIYRIAPPYRIYAIGDTDNMIAALNMTKGVIDNLRNNHRFVVTTARKSEVQIPRVLDDGVVSSYDRLIPIEE